MKETKSCQPTDPEWATLSWIEKKFQIRRGMAYKLIAAGKLKTTTISASGTRGVRRVEVASVRALLEEGATDDKPTY